MAQLSVLEPVTETRNTLSEEKREISAAERQHAKEIEIYRKMLYAGYSEAEATGDVAVAEPKEAAPEQKTSAARRFADYKAYSIPASKKMLFEDAYGSVDTAEKPVLTRPVQSPASSAATVTAPADAPAVGSENDEDLKPTRRTLETLRRSKEEQLTAQETKTSVFSAVSAKTKVVLAAIVFAVIMAIVVICINTGIINSLDANIEKMRAKVQEQQQNYENIANEIMDIENGEGVWGEIIKEFAENQGMVRP